MLTIGKDPETWLVHRVLGSRGQRFEGSAPCCANSPASPRTRWNARRGARARDRRRLRVRSRATPTLYLGLDAAGTQDREGRQGKHPDGSAKTREAKLRVVGANRKDGRPVRDPGSATYNAAIETIATRDTDTEPAPFARRSEATPRLRQGGAGSSWATARRGSGTSPTSTSPAVQIRHLPRQGPSVRVERPREQDRRSLDGRARGTRRGARRRSRRPAGPSGTSRRPERTPSTSPTTGANELPEVPGDLCDRRGGLQEHRRRTPQARRHAPSQAPTPSSPCAAPSRFDDFWERRDGATS